MIRKFLNKIFSKEWGSEELIARRKKRHDAAKHLLPTEDLRRSHLCPCCLKKSTWYGKLCDNCQETLDLWCPCDVEHEYTARDFKTKLASTKRVPLPDYIVSEHCNRCGHRIKPIWDLMMDEVTDDKIIDEKIEALLEDYERRAAIAETDFRQNSY